MINSSTTLGHVVFYVQNLEISTRFYQEIVGLQETGRTFNGRAAVLTGGSTHHELLLIEVNAEKRQDPNVTIGLYHVGWCIGDHIDQLREAIKRIKATGIEPVGMADHGITKSIYLHDPDGNEIELYVDNPDYDWKTCTDWLEHPVKSLAL